MTHGARLVDSNTTSPVDRPTPPAHTTTTTTPTAPTEPSHQAQPAGQAGRATLDSTDLVPIRQTTTPYLYCRCQRGGPGTPPPAPLHPDGYTA
jgi:hypothetical protein